MREVCCSIVSAVVFRLLYVFFIFQFGVVGATLGSIGGAVIGWKMRSLVEGVIRGGVWGSCLSYKLVKATFDHLHAAGDGVDELAFFLHVVKVIAGDLVKILGHDDEHNTIMGFNKVRFGKKAAYSYADFVLSFKHHDHSSFADDVE